jgi:predicted dehydrogenase
VRNHTLASLDPQRTLFNSDSEGELKGMDRRRLLQGLSMSAFSTRLLRTPPAYGQAAATPKQPEKPIGANDRVNVGVIGPGSRGLELTRQLLRIPGVEIIAVCDVYEPRFAQVNELVGKKVPGYKDFRELLARRDLDAVFIASPPVFHAEHVVASLNSGRPVYEEKTLGFTPEDCNKVVEAVRQSGQIFQIGHQMRYAAWIQAAMKRVQQGQIGNPTHVYGYWHRNDNWRRPVSDPGLEHLLNWRLYRESSGGLLEELGSHHIDIANWTFGEQPQSVLGSSSIAVYDDGRTVGDNVQAVFSYSKGRHMFFSSLTDNSLMADQVWIYGTEGSLQITLEDATFYYEPEKHKAVVAPSGLVQKGLKTGASFAPNTAMPYRGIGERVQVPNTEDFTLTACRSFIQSVRTKQPPLADVYVGYKSALACCIGRVALEEGQVKAIPREIGGSG